MYLISLYFDERTEKQLRSYITKLAKKSGNTFMLEEQVPPHITIGSAHCKDENAIKLAFEHASKNMGAGEVFIASTGCFFPGVCFVQPVLNEYLQSCLEQVYGEMSKMEQCEIGRCYKPYSWLPHITVSKKLTKEEMRMAFMVMQEQFVPTKGKIERIGLARTNPFCEIAEYSFV